MPIADEPIGIDATDIFPHELTLKVFSYLSLANLGKSCLVSKKWHLLASDHILWKYAIYKELAFGDDKWRQFLGKDVIKDEKHREDFVSLPVNEIIKDYRRFKSIFPEKNVKDGLMLIRLPKTLNGQLTLKSLGELAKRYFPNTKTGYGYLNIHMDKLGDKSINQSCWVLMTQDALPGSKGVNNTKQNEIMADPTETLIGFELPGTLEATTCILAQYFGFKIRLFSNKPRTYIHCKDIVKGFQVIHEDKQVFTIGGYQVAVGNFHENGLCIDIFDALKNEVIGIAALKSYAIKGAILP
ncbi:MULTISPECIES: F-box protein [Parachlamydia]|uniref:F-box domain-containing protein n=3 Tax=Parachlamydia acanthamoebae TaxID=83552 RepID=F8KZ30_PARAV|nr:F-box protein [Parachlamydia acanthamoebae]CCB86153.1 putative uncharacterized protein [Parachlamydia acanthamoebae UV-7]